ncbi:hypothetical protein [Sphingobium yanoikuyae]|uniref:Uncharacterized protein n=1 Tax=Sphingobium yanoikuyae TaxID=13690 RepID=A0A3G2UST6_SPHYA|nr:hypothetical protein [Sphingobium yanoikuyae]AYO78337.1 hypothetical protein EBF16_16440 [Sphingobium yanoikuyae]
MSFIDMEITRRQFEVRYINVGRAMLGTLADICCVDFDQAERWADEIDREAGILIAADRPIAGGIEGAVAPVSPVPSTHSQSVAFGSQGGSGAAPAAAAAPGQFPTA